MKTERESIVWSYLLDADSCIRAFQTDRAKIYLDSALCYEAEIANPKILGFLYAKLADFYVFKLDEQEAHRFYYKALEHYEKSEQTNHESLIIQIYNNLASSYFRKNDTETLKKIIDKILPLALSQHERKDLIDAYRMTAFYYGKRYKKERHIAFLDSAIYYDKAAIAIYDADSEAVTASEKFRPEEIAYNYINLASNLYERDASHPDTISAYVAKAEDMANPNDTAMLLNLLWMKGLVACKKDEPEKAKQLFTEQLQIMDRSMKGDPLSMYASLYQKLSEIAEKQNDNGKALEYERKRIDCLAQIHDSQQYETVRELETKHEVRQKEQEVERLTDLTAYQKKRNLLYIYILALLVIVFIVAGSRFRLMKKATETQLRLTRSEKNEALLQIKLREEQLEKEKFEKYDVLLDSHFKRIQISEMDDELRELRNEQHNLNALIGDYAGKLKNYEKRKSGETVFQTDEPLHTSVLGEIYGLIKRRIKDVSTQREYFEQLATVEDSFFRRLAERAESDCLSALEMQRCVAILIGMKAQDIAECFSVEPRSIHQARHRLKVKLKVDKETDLDMFLKQFSR